MGFLLRPDIKFVCTVALVNFTVCQGGPATAEALNPAAVAQIDAAAGQFISGGYAPGVSVAVVRKGQLIFAKAYGLENVETASPATADTVFRAGSITKMFTATAIMRLVQDGKISLDDPVSKYIPELVSVPTMTIRMLLWQTSGLHDYDATFVNRCQDQTTKQVVDFIAGQRPLLDFAPGSKWVYSNSNYFILGAIVERVSGQPLGPYLAANVIAPSGVTTTVIDHEASIVPHRASGYSPIKGRVGQFSNAECLRSDVAGGAGALRSNAADLARWQQLLLAGAIISKRSVADMITPGRLNDGKPTVRLDSPISLGPPSYAFGLEVGALDGQQTIGHAGSVPGFTSYLVTFPKSRLTVAIMTNGMPRDAGVFHAIEGAVLQASHE